MKNKEINMNKPKLALLPFLFISGLIVPVEEAFSNEFSANVGATSNYLWRDLEQTAGDAALYGGFDYSLDSGFYIGTWLSNASWSEGMTYEVDIYGGYSTKINKVTYGVGFIHYAYPDSIENVSFTEVNMTAEYQGFTLNYSVLANAEGASFGDDTYVNLSKTFEIASGYEGSIHIGMGTDNFYAGESFVGYGATISKKGFNFGISKNNLDNSDTKLFVSYTHAL